MVVVKRFSVFLIVVIIFFTICTRTSHASSPSPQYVYENIEQPLPFSISPNTIRTIDSHEEALRVFSYALDYLDDTDKQKAYVLEALAVLAEECIRYGGQDSHDALRRDILELSSQYEVVLLRELRLGINITPDNTEEFYFKEVDIPGNNAEHFYIDMPFATLRLNMRDPGLLNDISMRQISVDNEGESPAVISAFLGSWSIFIVFCVILISIFVEPLRKNKATRWVILSLCIILYGINFATLVLSPNQTSNTAEEEGVAVTLADKMTAILSIPIQDESEKDLTVIDGNGNPVPCKYNPITHMIDARIKESSTYSFGYSAVYFTDMEDKSTEMQHAVRLLTSRGLMDGADERSFLPDREITRAEFLSVIIRVMDLLDLNSENPFIDVLRSDWFYSVAASAYKEGVVTGFEDGTFRGNTPIPKIQMVSIVASALTRMMRYYTPEPDETQGILLMYTDNERIADWAQYNVALATKAGVVPERADGIFDSDSVMTRGDAAVMLYRLFSKIW